MTDGLRIAHPQDCPLEGNPEVGNPEIHPKVDGLAVRDHFLSKIA